VPEGGADRCGWPPCPAVRPAPASRSLRLTSSTAAATAASVATGTPRPSPRLSRHWRQPTLHAQAKKLPADASTCPLSGCHERRPSRVIFKRALLGSTTELVAQPRRNRGASGGIGARRSACAAAGAVISSAAAQRQLHSDGRRTAGGQPVRGGSVTRSGLGVRTQSRWRGGIGPSSRGFGDTVVSPGKERIGEEPLLFPLPKRVEDGS